MKLLFEPNEGFLILEKPPEPKKGDLHLPDHLKKSKVKQWEVVASHMRNTYQVNDTIILTDGAKVFTIELPTTEGLASFCMVEDQSVFGRVIKDVTV